MCLRAPGDVFDHLSTCGCLRATTLHRQESCDLRQISEEILIIKKDHSPAWREQTLEQLPSIINLTSAAKKVLLETSRETIQSTDVI